MKSKLKQVVGKVLPLVVLSRKTNHLLRIPGIEMGYPTNPLKQQIKNLMHTAASY